MDARQINLQVRHDSIKTMLEKFSVNSSELKWDSDKKSLLIESILLNLPIGSFTFYGFNECIDGNNRFLSVRSFMQDEFMLSNLSYLSFENRFFTELPQWNIRRIEEYITTINYIQPYCEKEVKKDLYLRFGKR